jgi:hypothetical protein
MTSDAVLLKDGRDIARKIDGRGDLRVYLFDRHRRPDDGDGKHAQDHGGLQAHGFVLSLNR